ncbi:MAG TPA: condensation domain-containing protein, partial [Longimicrobiaceae bacterium]|nr:condensation domain-containing protein [Longimicrobiaceae bacterium]
FVPLDPGHAPGRLADLAADASVSLVLAQERLLDRLRGTAAEVVCIDAEWPRIAREGAALPTAAIAPEQLAYVSYGPEAAGAPRGVCVDHRALLATTSAALEAFGPEAGDRVPCLAPFASEAWLLECLVPLLAGSTVRLVPGERALDAARLAADVEACTVVHATPALMGRLVREVVASGRGTLPGVRRAFVGGDSVAPGLLARMREVFPAAEVGVLHGPTGGGSSLYVLDRSGAPVPVGVPGELFLGGAGVARGYLGRPAPTAAGFLPDPFSPEPGARMYRTGARVRWLPSGELEHLGRVDGQVTVRGFRVDPGAVEEILAGEPEVLEAAVVAMDGGAGEERLVGYVVPAPGAQLSTGELRDRLKARLPGYMVPSALVVLEALPLGADGNTDRRALPAPPQASPEDEHTRPPTPTEEVVAAIWSQLLGVERVGVGADFFDLGGHSLVATRAVSRVAQVFGLDLPLRVMFEEPTVARLARYVDSAVRTEEALPPVRRTGAREAPLSFAQQRLWFLEQLHPGNSAYNLPVAFRLAGSLDEEALERSLARIVERHEVLRTTFREVEGVPVQLVHPPAGRVLRTVELGGLPAARSAPALAALLEAEAARPFDLERGPLFRAHLFRLRGEAVLLLVMHHVVGDGWSTGVLHRELEALYAAARAGEPDPLPELPVQYADFSLWQREHLDAERLAPHLAYWRERLAGA